VTTVPIRVLVADDSVVVRRLVTNVLSSSPGIEVVGSAPNGRIALAKIDQLDPDLVTLDVEMPDMDGIETLIAIRERRPHLPVIMFSTLTERGAVVTLEALMRGANDYVTKPANVGSVNEAMERVRSELVPRVHSLCGFVDTATPTQPTRPSVAPPRRVPPAVPPRVDAVVIGISTGGPSALAEIVPRLPGELAVPVLIVQHMPPMFTRLLAERLDRSTGLGVAEASGGESASPGTCWIAPGDRHLVVEAGGGGAAAHLRVDDGPRENSCRPAVDVLFRSASATYGPHLLAVVMTGMGQDGLAGCEHVVAAGGQVIVQDEASSVVWGMPGSVARAGLADAVLPLDALPAEIARRVAVGRASSRPVAGVGS
jgi:two-component system, chemotaxis family, protein-glutamate methylesterase/glutaminase